jgi:hypothetical protein
VNNLFLVRYFFFLHVSGDYVPTIRRNNCIYVTLGTCYSVWMTAWYAGAYALAYQTVIHVSTCFGRLCAHHQKKQLYLCNTWYLSLCTDDCLICIQDSRPKHVDKRNRYTKKKLCTKLTLFTRLYRDAHSTNFKIPPKFHCTEMMNCCLFHNYTEVLSSAVGFLHTVLSWKIFQPLSRLTFCIYLVHLPLITTRTLMARVPIYFDGLSAVSCICSKAFNCLIAIYFLESVKLTFMHHASYT